jgi:hypothetical protein
MTTCAITIADMRFCKLYPRFFIIDQEIPYFNESMNVWQDVHSPPLDPVVCIYIQINPTY